MHMLIASQGLGIFKVLIYKLFKESSVNCARLMEVNLLFKLIKMLFLWQQIRWSSKNVTLSGPAKNAVKFRFEYAKRNSFHFILAVLNLLSDYESLIFLW